jgi:hypothetical protein
LPAALRLPTDSRPTDSLHFRQLRRRQPTPKRPVWESPLKAQMQFNIHRGGLAA